MKAVTKAEAIRYFTNSPDGTLFCPQCYSELEKGKCTDELCFMDDILGIEDQEIVS